MPVAELGVVVVARNDAPSLGACLDALVAQQDSPPFDVVVADAASTDATADVALHHPVVRRVALSNSEHLPRACYKAFRLTSHPILAVVEAAAAPAGDWLGEAVREMKASGADVVLADGGVLLTRQAATDVALFGRLGQPDAVEAVIERASAAALRVASTTERFPLPVTAPTGEHAVTDGEPSRFTVAVCTKGRPESLERLLRSLAALEDADVELMVVDNAPQPELSPSEVARFGARYVHEPRRGLDAARNRAVMEATGDVVAFIDDDCEATASWIPGLRAAFADPNVTLVTGRVLPASLARPEERWFESWFTFDHGTEPQRFTRHDTGREWFPTYPSHLGTGCNMAFRREVFLKFARFDERLDMGTRIGGGGDLDMFAQFIDAGEVALYTPDAVVIHYHRSDPAALRRQFFGYGVATGALCTKFALTRPGLRKSALRFYLWRLRTHADRLRRRDPRHDRFPMPLVLLEAAGNLWGPMAFLISRPPA